MKLDALRKIIKEELAAALKENAPAKEKETVEAPPTTKPGTTPKRRGFDPTPIKREPGKEPLIVPKKAKTNSKETEKELVNKITQRFLKLKK